METIVNIHNFYSLNLWRILSGGLGWSSRTVNENEKPAIKCLRFTRLTEDGAFAKEIWIRVCFNFGKRVTWSVTKMALCGRGVFIALLLGLSLVHYSQNKCEPFGDDFPLTLDKFELTFETKDLEESVTCGDYVPLQEFKDSFKRTAPIVKYSNAVRVCHENGPSF